VHDGIHIDDLILILFLFADDMASVGKTSFEIQNQLDRLLEYCNAWGLKVNTAKTKIMVFRKRGGLLPTERWTYDSQPIDVVKMSLTTSALYLAIRVTLDQILNMLLVNLLSH